MVLPLVLQGPVSLNTEAANGAPKWVHSAKAMVYCKVQMVSVNINTVMVC